MPRARWLKPEFFTDRKMGELGPVNALVYQVLWVSADDSGMAKCQPDDIKAEWFRHWPSVNVATIRTALRRLRELGRIEFYVGGDDLFAQVVRWKENQNVHKPSKFMWRTDYSARGKALSKHLPEWYGGGAGALHASPPPRHLDA